MPSGVIGDIAERKDRPAYARFERRVIENKAESIKVGRYVGKDVDFVLLTPPYSVDVFEQKVTSWFEQMKVEVAQGRLPQVWADKYKESYEKWLKGQELPLDGVPIKGWGVCSPAQQENLIKLNILTVEDLAYANDEAIRRIGMGAVDLRQKAKAWLMNMANHGQVTIELAALRTQNENQAIEIKTLKEQVQKLLEQGVNHIAISSFAQSSDGGLILSDQVGNLPLTPAPEPKEPSEAAKRVAAKLPPPKTSPNAEKIMSMEIK